jgi:parallel beta-helix repeat protein
MKLTVYVRRSICICFALLSSLHVLAKAVNVQCGGTQHPNSISEALGLLNPNVPNTLTVSGTCNENVVINKFNRLTLVGKSGSRVVDASGKVSQTILVIDSTDVVFQNMNIDGGSAGIQCDSFSVCRFSGDTVRNSDAGIQITQSRAELDTTSIRHTQNGLTSLDASSVRIDFGIDIENNLFGIDVVSGSTLESYGATVSNNQFAGLYVSSLGNLLLSSTSITGNGNGIEVDSHSNINLLSGNTITGNQEYGIYLFDLSFARFDPGNNVTGNNTGGTGALDIACFEQFTATRGAGTNTGGGTTNCAESGGKPAPKSMRN